MSAPLPSRTAPAVRLAAVPRTSALAGAVAVLAVLLSAAAVAVHLATPVPDRAGFLRTPEVTLGPALALTGALLVRRPAARRLPLLLLAVGLCCATYAAACATTAATGGTGALGTAASWLASWTWAGGFPPLAVLLPLLFPDGRPPSARWRPVVAAAGLLVVLLCLLAAASPGEVAGLPGTGNPAGVAALEPVRAGVQAALGAALAALSVVALGSLVVRHRAAGGVERRQVAWLGYGLAVVVAGSFLTSGPLLHLLSLALPAAVLVAVVRYRLYVVDALVDRTVVGAVLLAGAALVHTAVAGWAGAALGRQGALPGVLGATAVALLFAPARRRVQVAVDRMLHGRRGDPYALLTGVATALQASRSPRAALQQVAAEVAEGLRLPAVEVAVDLPGGGRAVARAGDPGLPLPHAVPLTWQGQALGALAAAPRPGDDALEPLDRRLLADVADQLAPVAWALRLSQDVEQGRSDLVTAVADERRRLRRDLHDGLGPQLAAVALGLSTAERALGRADTARAADLLVGARAQLEGGVAEVRRLVHGLRPPALDDLGLLDALRSTGPAAGGALRVEVEGEGLPALPAAVEVAAYRIVQEALTNVVRHAGAGSAAVRLDVDGDVLRVEVVDDGCGVPAQRTAGVGTVSMRERAEELGGTCVVEPAPGGGTRVRARLPLPAPATGSASDRGAVAP